MARIDLRQTGHIMFFFNHWSIHLMWKLWIHRSRLILTLSKNSSKQMGHFGVCLFAFRALFFDGILLMKRVLVVQSSISRCVAPVLLSRNPSASRGEDCNQCSKGPEEGGWRLIGRYTGVGRTTVIGWGIDSLI